MKFFLRRQLRSNGATKKEADELAKLGEQISSIELPVLNSDTKARIAADIGFVHHPYRRTSVIAMRGAFAAILVIIIIAAQSAESGSALYIVKQGTDTIKNFVAPILPVTVQPVEQDDDSQDDRHTPNSILQDDSGKTEDSGSGRSPHSSSSELEINDSSSGSSSGSSNDSSGSGKSGSSESLDSLDVSSGKKGGGSDD